MEELPTRTLMQESNLVKKCKAAYREAKANFLREQKVSTSGQEEIRILTLVNKSIWQLTSVRLGEEPQGKS